MSITLICVLVAGTVLRLTRLVNKDTILEPWRNWVQAKAIRAEDRNDEWRILVGYEQQVAIRMDVFTQYSWVWTGEGEAPSLPHAYRAKWRGGFYPWLDDLIGCPWCISVYAAVPTATAALLWPTNTVIQIGLLACTASWVAGIVTAHTE